MHPMPITSFRLEFAGLEWVKADFWGFLHPYPLPLPILCTSRLNSCSHEFISAIPLLPTWFFNRGVQPKSKKLGFNHLPQPFYFKSLHYWSPCLFNGENNTHVRFGSLIFNALFFSFFPNLFRFETASELKVREPPNGFVCRVLSNHIKSVKK